MDANKNGRPKKSEPLNQLQKVSFRVDENQEPDLKYLLAFSELELLKKHIQNLKHDLRNPLSGISGLIDMLIVEGEDQIEVQTSDLIMIKESAESLLDLINRALVLHNTQNLKECANIDRNLSSVIKEIHRLYLPMTQTKSILLSLKSQIKQEIQFQPNFFVNLIQITGNLVANAVKFTPSHGSVDVVFSLNADKNYNTLNMTVTDTGKGISPDQVSAFNQGKPIHGSTGTNGEQGFGIGLQHVLQMVS